MTSPALVVDVSDLTPPYEQLRKQLADLIAARVLAPGERLPPLRQLARDLGLAVGTVARTYRELEAAGLVRSRRGGGTRVADTPPPLTESQRHRLLHELATRYARQMAHLGFDLATATAAIGTAWAHGADEPRSRS